MHTSASRFLLRGAAAQAWAHASHGYIIIITSVCTVKTATSRLGDSEDLCASCGRRRARGSRIFFGRVGYSPPGRPVRDRLPLCRGRKKGRNYRFAYVPRTIIYYVRTRTRTCVQDRGGWPEDINRCPLSSVSGASVYTSSRRTHIHTRASVYVYGRVYICTGFSLVFGGKLCETEKSVCVPRGAKFPRWPRGPFSMGRKETREKR